MGPAHRPQRNIRPYIIIPRSLASFLHSLHHPSDSDDHFYGNFRLPSAKHGRWKNHAFDFCPPRAYLLPRSGFLHDSKERRGDSTYFKISYLFNGTGQLIGCFLCLHCEFASSNAGNSRYASLAAKDVFRYNPYGAVDAKTYSTASDLSNWSSLFRFIGISFQL